MKLSRIIPIVMLIGSISTLALSCAPKAGSAATTTNQIVTAQRGNLSVAITTVGNLALSVKQDLAFEIPGTVQEVLVNAGDTVKNGQVLATLDTTTWDTTVTQLQRAVTTAQRKVTSTQIALRNAQNAVVTANNTVTSKGFALRSAQLSYQSDSDSLNQISDIQKIQDRIDALQNELKSATGQTQASIDSNKELIAQYNREIQSIISGTSTTVSSDTALAVAKAELKLEQDQLGITTAQLDLQNAQVAVTDAKNAIAPAQEDIQNAQDDLKTAQKNLDDAKSNSPEVKAPFDGFITAVNVKGGDDVKKGTIAVTLADPNKFEAEVLVNETDISKVKVGGTASVALQAVSGTSLSANVTNIAPTATIQQGVVNYKVTVELQSLEPAAQALRQSGTNFTSGNASSVIPFGGGGPAFGGGNLTQEQITQNIQQRQQTFGGQGGRGGPGAGSANLTQEQITQAIQQRQQAIAGQAGSQSQIPGQFSRQSQAAAASTANIKLAEGMTVTVSILVDSRTNVVLVPSGAITTSGGQTSVKLVNADNTTATRAIQTGITDHQNTEVTSGLNAGEKVMVTKTTSASSSSNTATGSTTRVAIPGVGGLGGGGAFGR